MKKLVPTALPSRLSQLADGWKIIGEHHLEHTYLFPDFKSGLAFVNQVGQLAEERNHHPDIHLAWGRVRIELWTHAAGGLTQADFDFAAKIDAQLTPRRYSATG